MTKTTESKWRGLIAEQEASGLTVREFAAGRGLSASTLFWWRSRLRREGRSVAELVPVEVTELPAIASTAIELVVGDDVVLRLPRGFDESDFAACWRRSASAEPADIGARVSRTRRDRHAEVDRWIVGGDEGGARTRSLERPSVRVLQR